MLQRKDVPELDLLRVIRDRWVIIRSTEDVAAWPPFPSDLMPQFPEKLIESRMEQLCSRGYLDWGVTLRGAWLTPEGEARLRQLEAESGSTG